jgi:hypothetical protein
LCAESIALRSLHGGPQKSSLDPNQRCNSVVLAYKGEGAKHLLLGSEFCPVVCRLSCSIHLPVLWFVRCVGAWLDVLTCKHRHRCLVDTVLNVTTEKGLCCILWRFGAAVMALAPSLDMLYLQQA